MKFLLLILFGISLTACHSLPNIENPNYCNSSASQVSYHIYATQSNAEEPTIHNSTIVGKSALGKNPFKSIVFQQGYDYENQPFHEIGVELKDGRGRDFIDFTHRNIGKQIGIVADGQLIHIAYVRSALGSSFILTSDKPQEIQDLFERLKFANCQ